MNVQRGRWRGSGKVRWAVGLVKPLKNPAVLYCLSRIYRAEDINLVIYYV